MRGRERERGRRGSRKSENLRSRRYPEKQNSRNFGPFKTLRANGRISLSCGPNNLNSYLNHSLNLEHLLCPFQVPLPVYATHFCFRYALNHDHTKVSFLRERWKMKISPFWPWILLRLFWVQLCVRLA
jgi:hypothetical protein